jgi:hypothetical protein
MSLYPDLLARDAGLLALGACAMIAVLLKIEPRLFRRHFPEPLRSRAPPLQGRARALGALAGLGLAAFVIGVLAVSTLSAERRGAGFGDLFLHAFLVGSAFNLADWLLLDELWLGAARGRGLLPAEVVAAGLPFEHGKHAADFLRGTVIFAALALIVAAGVALV